MKKLLSPLLLFLGAALILTFTSCGSDDEDPGGGYEFIDQNLQGIIDGIPFEFGEGTFESSFFTEGAISLDLYDSNEEFDNVCEFIGFGDQVKIFFEVTDEVGLYELSFDLNSFSGQTITLFNPEGSVNNIATIGAVEILSITDTQLTGRMDARMDAENSVNGNFTVVFCAEN
ncbi:hypothetical protein [Ekhidna sp.]|uniref:hypothetical protein n=1 Tax=Ekhidna sp. TaxID=2608089 RepID=UPI0032979712